MTNEPACSAIPTGVPDLRFCQGRNDADQCMPILLRMLKMQDAAPPEAWRLLCVLFLRLSEMSAKAG
jgi:hypothetical protein